MTYIRTVFAQSGDRTIPGFDDPADGSVSFETGYGPQYSQDPTSVSTARRIEREKFNGVMYALSLEIQKQQQQSYPDWISSADNGGSPFSYSKGDTVKYSGEIYRSLINSNTSTPASGASWYNLDALRPLSSAKSANYPITDTDNIKYLPVTTGASTITITLPAAANNVGRPITIFKADNGAGKVLIDGASSELIGQSLTLDLLYQFQRADLVSIGTGWLIIYASPVGELRIFQADPTNSHGTTNNKIRLLNSTPAVDLGGAFTYSYDTALGSSITVNRDCIAVCKYRDRGSSGTQEFGISINASGADLTTGITSLTTTKRLGLTWTAATLYGETGFSEVRLKSGDVLRPHTGGSLNETTGAVEFFLKEAKRLA